MRTIPRLAVILVVLAVGIMAALPVSASNLQQATPTPPPPAPTPVYGAHTVQQGEWLYCIGRAYQVQPWAIAQASGIPGPYGPYMPYGYSNPYVYHPTYGYYHPYYGSFYPYYYPWNYLYPGQHLNIPFSPSTAWYNIPAAPVGPACVAQFALPAGWPPPQPTGTPYPAPYPAPY